MEELTTKELEEILKEKKATKRHKKRRMKSGKRALFLSFYLCAVLIAFTMAMIFQGKDTSSLSILAVAGVGILPVMYNIHTKSETQINLKHMEKNYIEDYDNKEGIY